MMKLMVSAFPEQGNAARWRAGARFTETPVEVTVLDADDPEGQPRPADRPMYTLTPKQYEQLRGDLRIRVESLAGEPPPPAARPAREAASDDAAAAKHGRK